VFLIIAIRIRSLIWFATGAVLAVTMTLVFANAWRVDAAPGDTDTTFVPLATPCRLIDTRPAPDRVGTTATFGTAETVTLQATGTNGQCVIPADAVGLSLNVTALNATVESFLTLWPGGTRPLVSSLNPAPGQPPVPNAVTVTLSGAGAFDLYNHLGSVDVIVDINGYSTKSSLQELTNRLTTLETTTADLETTTADLETATADLETATGNLETATAVLDASQPFTVASEPVLLARAESTATAIRQVTVTAPVAGHVATIASGSMFEFTDGQIVQCGLMDSVTLPPDDVGVLWQSPTGGNESHLSASRVFTIAAGETATYTLVCRNTTGGTSTIRSPQVTAIFTPAP